MAPRRLRPLGSYEAEAARTLVLSGSLAQRLAFLVTRLDDVSDVLRPGERLRVDDPARTIVAMISRADALAKHRQWLKAVQTCQAAEAAKRGRSGRTRPPTQPPLER